MNAGIVIALALIVLAAIFALLVVGLLWYLFQRPLPRLKGEEIVRGLQAPAEVVRDRWGVPHIYAANEHDVFFAQGYIHAQDRLFQMDYARRLARGNLAEAFGTAALEADRWSRVLGFWRCARADLALLSAEEMDALQAYAAGANACIESNGLRLPAEFAILGFRPDPWTAHDTLGVLKVLAWALSQNWEGELLRLQFLAHLGPDRAAELEGFSPPGTSHEIFGRDGQSEAGALADAAGSLLAAYQSVSGWFGQPALAGSNNWVISAERSATRRPLLANDPHLTASMPALWYENHLVSGDGGLQVTGATIPGVPGVLTGHNAHIAWGITAGRADTQDLYLEQRHPTEPSWFRYQNQWEGAGVLREQVDVRGQADPHMEEVIITRHGPLVNGLLPAQEARDLPGLALRWSGHEVGTTVRGLLRVQKATDWESFRAALAWVTEPSLNFVYADTRGNVGYQYVGRVPRRRAGHGLLPAPGDSDSHEWDGWIPFEDLPCALNPEQGYLLSANNKPSNHNRAPGPYLGEAWCPSYRATRIERMLQAKPRYTLRDFQRLQTDVHSVEAEALLPFLIMVDGETPLERRIVRELESWNLRMEVDSFAAAAYQVMRLHLLRLVFADKLEALTDAYLGRSHSDIFASSAFVGIAGQTLIRLLEDEENPWFRDTASGEARTRDQLLRLALRRTATTLYDLIGKDPRKWAWGKVHQVEFEHLLGRGRLLRAIFNRGQYPIAGDEHTVWMTAYDLELPFGLVTTTATYRQVIDVGEWDRSTAILSTGQSGQPGSPYYANHIEMWREGDQHPMLWSRQSVEQEAVAVLQLRPSHGEVA